MPGPLNFIRWAGATKDIRSIRTKQHKSKESIINCVNVQTGLTNTYNRIRYIFVYIFLSHFIHYMTMCIARYRYKSKDIPEISFQEASYTTYWYYLINKQATATTSLIFYVFVNGRKVCVPSSVDVPFNAAICANKRLHHHHQHPYRQNSDLQISLYPVAFILIFRRIFQFI